MNKTPNLARIFNGVRVVGLVSEANSGKSNNIISMIQEFRKSNTETPIFVYGFNGTSTEYLKGMGCKELSGRKAMKNLSDCIIILDEFQELSLNDRRYRESTDKLFNFMYHKNVAILLSSPDARSFNTVIGSKVQRWLLKSVDPADCINGSQAKRMVEEYANVDDCVMYPKNQAVMTGSTEKIVLSFEYVEDVDTKKQNKDIFAVTKKLSKEPVSKNCQDKIVKKGDNKK